jgi:hypothetical protein
MLGFSQEYVGSIVGSTGFTSKVSKSVAIIIISAKFIAFLLFENLVSFLYFDF